MSYHGVIGGLSEGDLVTFNGSGGANARATDELEVVRTGMYPQGLTAEFEETLIGARWRVRHVDVEDGYVIEYEKNGHHPDAEPYWRRFDEVETIELVGVTGGDGD